MIAREFSHYRVLERLGGGGMGVVFRAEDLRLHRTVALKFLPPEWTRDPDRRSRLLQEARAASALDHPGICTIYEIDETPEGELFIAMAFYEGETLDRALERGPLPVATALRIALAVGEGLSRAHHAGIVHRDVKPANLMVTRHGDVKILDFGLAKLSGQAGITQTGKALGTAAYMSPEQARAEAVDGRTDIWSLAVVLYEMVAGRRPFMGETAALVLVEILQNDPPPLGEIRAGVPAGLPRVLARAMAKQRESRYATIDGLLADLRALARGLGLATDPRLDSDDLATLSMVKLDLSSLPTAEQLTTRRARRRLTRRAFVVLGSAGVLGGGLAVVVGPRLFGGRPTLVVRDFEAAAGLDPRLGRVVSRLLLTRLETLDDLEILGEPTYRDLMALHGGDEPALWRAERVRGSVAGRASRAGEMLIIEARLEAEGEPKPVTTTGPGLDSLLLFQVDSLAEKVAGYAGWRLPSKGRVADMTTASYAAFAAYLDARDQWDTLAVSEAQAAVAASLMADAAFALAHHLGAEIAIFIEHMDEARAHLKEAMRRVDDLDPVARHRLLALAADLAMDTRAKRRHLERVVERRPHDKTAHYDLAEAYFHRADAERASVHYERSLEIRPDYAPSINHLGYCRLYQGRVDEGLLLLERYKSLTGEANAFDSLGDGHFYAGDFREAITDKETALAKDPSLTWIDTGLAYVLFLKGCVRRALDLNERTLSAERARDRAYALVQRAHFLHELGVEGALSSVREAQRLYDPDTIHELIPELHSLAALVLLGAGRIDEAGAEVDWMARVVERDRIDEVNYYPLLKFYLLARAEYLLRIGRAREGARTYRRLAALGARLAYWTPPFERAHCLARKAIAEIRQGDLSTAAATVAEGLGVNASHPDVRLAELALLGRQGRSDAYRRRLADLREFYRSYPQADEGQVERVEVRIDTLTGNARRDGAESVARS